MAIRAGGTGGLGGNVARAPGWASGGAGQPRSLTRDALQRLLRNKAAIVGLAVIAIDVLLAIFAPVLAPYSPTQQDLLATYANPSREHLLGTDALGRDVLSRTLYGARISMSVALVTVTLIVLIGLPLGLIAGYFGGALDFLLMRVIDAMLALPDILFVILITTYLNAALPRASDGPLLPLKELNGATGGLVGVFIALALFGWLGLCRLSRSAILALRHHDFITSARAAGASHARIMLHHLLPNALAPVIIMVALLVPSLIIAEAGLSFIGLGVQPPQPSWGTMIAEGVTAIRAHPHLTVVPGLAIAITLLAFNFLGDGLRDALDPALH